jgi:hypothetical protein
MIRERRDDAREPKGGTREPAPAPKGRSSLWIELIPCTCGGRGQDPWAHADSCPRGRALRHKRP